MSALRALVYACVIGLLGACSTARIAQFDGFAAAGIKYADTIPLRYSLASAVLAPAVAVRSSGKQIPHA